MRRKKSQEFILSIRLKPYNCQMARPYCSDLRIAFLSDEQALCVKQCLEGDDELQPTKIDKSIDVDGKVLIM